MSEYRALLTDREREVVSGWADESRKYVYQIRSGVRGEIERIAEDITILEKHEPERLELFVETVSEAT